MREKSDSVGGDEVFVFGGIVVVVVDIVTARTWSFDIPLLAQKYGLSAVCDVSQETPHGLRLLVQSC